AATYSGFTTINAAGGSILLSGNSTNGTAGGLLDTSAVTLNIGTALQVDKSIVNSTNQLRDLATITLNGPSSLDFFGSPTGNSTEAIGALTVATDIPGQIFMREGNGTTTDFGNTVTAASVTFGSLSTTSLNISGQGLNGGIGDASGTPTSPV